MIANLFLQVKFDNFGKKRLFQTVAIPVISNSSLSLIIIFSLNKDFQNIWKCHFYHYLSELDKALNKRT